MLWTVVRVDPPPSGGGCLRRTDAVELVLTGVVGLVVWVLLGCLVGYTAARAPHVTRVERELPLEPVAAIWADQARTI